MKYTGGGLVGAGAAASTLPGLLSSGAGAQVEDPLDPADIPKFAHELPRPRVFAPRVVRDRTGRVIRHDYNISTNVINAQVLPPGLPQTRQWAYGGRVFVPGSDDTEFAATAPGPVFDNTRGIPARVTWDNRIDRPHIFAVDPVIHYANPNAMEPPEPPFEPFPPGYARAQFPVPIVTHTHGLVVRPEFDGTADFWFTRFGQRGPSYVSNVYEMPNEQPSTQLFYHDHAMGETRLNVFAGLVGPAYFIRDPNSPLDRPDSPLPSGEFELPLTLTSRAFFTDGQLDFPRVGRNPFFPYMEAEDFSQVAVVNGKTWPNLNVQRRQYRFRVLIGSNMRVWTLTLDNNGALVPFTIIGSDGGYLPQPLVATEFTMGITERTDILVDFSQFAAGTQIIMRNTLLAESDDPEHAGQVMRLTVVDSEPVAPPALDPGLFPPRPELPTNAPTRTKATVRFRDLFEDEETGDELGTVTKTDRQRTFEGLGFTTPVTELPLVGSTEQWDIVNTNEVEVPADDPDFGFHLIHIHLIEFQILNRQEIDQERYLQDWFLLNGRKPVTRPIVLDTNDYLVGDPMPPDPNETGWKDTAQSRPSTVTRLRLRWAPQETPTGGVQPGENQFPMEVEFPSGRDPFTGPGFVWHCHMLNHEDNEMMRQLALVRLWASGVRYPVGRIVAHDDINYRVRVAHTSQASEPPTARFDLWERVNNNDGSWQPQIIYAIEDRVLHNGQLFEALRVHQAEPGQVPPDHPELWAPLPMAAKEQLVAFCDPNDPNQAPFFDIGQNGTEDEAREVLQAALATCRPIEAMPSAGITEEAIHFMLPDGEEFSPDPAPGTVFYETMSRLLSITVDRLGRGQSVTVNGRALRSGRTYPLPPQRHMGYLIRTTGGATFTAR
ncbi:MAG: carbohydrate-binding protein [Acidimicrobiales bacterium]